MNSTRLVKIITELKTYIEYDVLQCLLNNIHHMEELEGDGKYCYEIFKKHHSIWNFSLSKDKVNNLVCKNHILTNTNSSDWFTYCQCHCIFNTYNPGGPSFNLDGDDRKRDKTFDATLNNNLKYFNDHFIKNNFTENHFCILNALLENIRHAQETRKIDSKELTDYLIEYIEYVWANR